MAATFFTGFIITPAIKYLKIIIPACLLQAGEGVR